MKTTKRNRILNGSKLLNKLYKLIHIPETRLTASYSATDGVCIVTNISVIESTPMTKLIRTLYSYDKRHNGSKIPISRKTHERVFGNAQHPL